MPSYTVETILYPNGLPGASNPKMRYPDGRPNWQEFDNARDAVKEFGERVGMLSPTTSDLRHDGSITEFVATYEDGSVIVISLW